MKYMRVLEALLCEPWVIRPEMHEVIMDVVRARLRGAESNFVIDLDEEPEKPRIEGNISIIPVKGVIARHISQLDKISGGTDTNTLSEWLMDARENDAVDGILLEIDSPGGRTVGVAEVADLIADIEKPVVSFTDGQMASAAYWIGAGADAIYASRSSMVGSIGVYIAFLDDSKAFEMRGLKMDLIKAGRFKGIGVQGMGLNEESRALVQSQVDEIYDMFTRFVLEHRVLDDETMQGQVFLGENSVENNLIDQVGGFDDAMEELRALIG